MAGKTGVGGGLSGVPKGGWSGILKGLGGTGMAVNALMPFLFAASILHGFWQSYKMDKQMKEAEEMQRRQAQEAMAAYQQQAMGGVGGMGGAGMGPGMGQGMMQQAMQGPAGPMMW